MKRFFPHRFGIQRAIVMIAAFCIMVSIGQAGVSLKKRCTESLYILADDLLLLQDTGHASLHEGALYCKACSDYHTRASESVLPFAVAYRESRKERYRKAAIATGEWLIRQQQHNGSWIETPSDWTGTTTDQLLSLSVAYPILKSSLTEEQSIRWTVSMKRAADWLVGHMNHEFASINYCATTTATMMLVYRNIPDSAYVRKAKELALLVRSKFDDDYFLTGEGNRVRGTKYGIDLGYNMDMAMWGMGLYARLSGDTAADNAVRHAVERLVYFIYPDGSTEGSWGVRSGKWTTYGSMTADGSQILFSLYARENPVCRTAAIANLDYFMKMRVGGLLTYGPEYSAMFTEPPCIYPTFCRAKNLAMAIVFGDQGEGDTPKLPSQNIGWSKYFKTIDVVLIRTKYFMATVTGYRYKDMRQGSNFKYMYRPSGGSLTNLWVEGYGHLQASSQTEYRQWEMNYPKTPPRIEFTDTAAYYSNLYEFDAHMELSESGGTYTVQSSGEMKDKNRWEGGVAYTISHTLTDTSIEKTMTLRYHGAHPVIRIIEPIIQDSQTVIQKMDARNVLIKSHACTLLLTIESPNVTMDVGIDADLYRQPLPSWKGYPIRLTVLPERESFLKEIKYKISMK
jgi:hypothetical protein